MGIIQAVGVTVEALRRGGARACHERVNRDETAHATAVIPCLGKVLLNGFV